MSDILPPNTQSLDSGAARLIAGLETTANGIIGHCLLYTSPSPRD